MVKKTRMPRPSGSTIVALHPKANHLKIQIGGGLWASLAYTEVLWLRDYLNEWLDEQDKPRYRDDGAWML